MRNSKLWISILILLVAIFSMAVIVGCGDDTDKDNDNNNNDVYQPSDGDFEEAAGAAANVASLSSTVSTANSTGQQAERGDWEWDNNGCPLVTMTGEIGNRILTINYADGCVVEGVSLSGVISGAWNYQLGSGLTANLDINEFTVEDAVTNGQVEVTATASGFVGGTLTVNGNVSYTDAAGQSQSLTVSQLTANFNLNGTPADPFDDVYSLDGSGTYIDVDNLQYSLDFDNVTENFLCYFPVSGILTMVGPEYTAIIDFGDGECDSEVTITIGDITRTVDLVEFLSE